MPKSRWQMPMREQRFGSFFTDVQIFDIVEMERHLQGGMQMSDNSKFQQKQVRRYLKGVRFRMRRRQRFFLYGLAVAVFLYLAGVYELREKIWSIKECEEIEYWLPEGNSEVVTRIRIDLKTWQLEMIHEENRAE